MNELDPSSINLENTSKLFEYEKLSREIEECDDLEILRNTLRYVIKLHMKQQEVISGMGGPPDGLSDKFIEIK